MSLLTLPNLGTGIGFTGAAEVTAAVITASVAVLVVLLGQVLMWWREARGRAETRRRQALMDAQDAALQLRGRLRDYGKALTDNVHSQEPQFTFAPTVPAGVESARDDADGLFDVCLTRVESVSVRSALHDWREAAMSRFISPDEVPASAESQAWLVMNQTLSRALLHT